VCSGDGGGLVLPTFRAHSAYFLASCRCIAFEPCPGTLLGALSQHLALKPCARVFMPQMHNLNEEGIVVKVRRSSAEYPQLAF
jgi:hypothetical protein